jgi:hypothetical protein
MALQPKDEKLAEDFAVILKEKGFKTNNHKNYKSLN